MHPVNGKGFLAGAVAWLTYIFVASYRASCAEFKDCGAGDLMLYSLIAVGMLMPAWLLASFVSSIFPDKLE